MSSTNSALVNEYRALLGGAADKRNYSAPGASGRSGGSSSSAAAAAAAAASSLAVPRDTLLQVLTRRRERAVACRSLPAALVVYCVAMYTVLEHGRIADSYDVETSLVDNVVWAGATGFPEYVYSAGDIYPYLTE